MINNAKDMRIEVRENMRGGAGSVTIRHCLEKDDFSANVRLCAVLTLPPGAGIGPHRHEAEEEVFLVTRGSGVLDDGTAESRIAAGDAILTGNGGSHAVRNDGTEPLEIVALIVCDPPKDPA